MPVTILGRRPVSADVPAQAPTRDALTRSAQRTQLAGADEVGYRNWMQSIGHTREKGFAVDDTLTGTDYDYRGFYKQRGAVQLGSGEHLTDEFKLPNHPTFSNESIYATGDAEQFAGSWDGDTFKPPANTAGAPRTPRVHVYGRRPVGSPGDSVEWSDYGRMAMSTFASMGAGLGWILEKFGQQAREAAARNPMPTGMNDIRNRTRASVGLPPEQRDPDAPVPGEIIGRWLQGQATDASNVWIDKNLDAFGITQEGLSDTARRALEVDFLGQGSYGDKWNKAKLTAVGSLPATLGGIGAGGVLAKALGAAGAGARTAAAIGYGLGEAGTAAPMAGAAVQQEIMGMSHDELLQSPEYRATFEALAGLPMDERVRKSRQMIASAASGDAAALTMVTTFLLSAPAGAMMTKGFGLSPRDLSRARTALKEGGVEALQEFFQSGTEAMSQNVAMRNAGFDRELWDQVLEQAVGGALSGAPLGAAMGFASPERAEGEDVPPPPPSDEIPPVTMPQDAVNADDILGEELPPEGFAPDELNAGPLDEETAGPAAVARPPSPQDAAAAAGEAQDQRLNDETYRGLLGAMGGELIPGGGVAYEKDEHGTITGRTPSQNPQWFQALRDSGASMTVKGAQGAIDKALAGEKLTAREQRFVDAALAHIDTQLAEQSTDRRAGDRRQDAAERRRVEEMSPEEMRRELLTSPLTGLQNRRAYDDSDRLPVQVAIDADSLKWVNDTLGHEAGDEMLRAIGGAIANATDRGYAMSRGYHLSGDEFVIEGASDDAVNGILEQIEERLAMATIEATSPEGETITLNGLGISYGRGSTLDEADQQLRGSKQARERQGLRAARGEQPPSASRSRGRQTGLEDQDQAAADQTRQALIEAGRVHAEAAGADDLSDDQLADLGEEVFALSGGDVSPAQALADEQRRRDESRSPNRDVSIETGDPSDMFSAARKQIDITDATPRRKVSDERRDTTADVEPAKPVQAPDRSAAAESAGAAAGQRGAATEQPLDDSRAAVRDTQDADEVRAAIEDRGVTFKNLVEAERLYDSHTIYAFNEMDEEPSEVTSLNMLRSYTAERLVGVPRANESAKPVVSANKVFTEDAAAKARALLKSKLSTASSGIDPEVMQAGITLAGYHIEKGARTFAAYSAAMIEDLGDVVRPYLKSWYMAVKYDPRAGDFAGDMNSAADVEKADVAAPKHSQQFETYRKWIAQQTPEKLRSMLTSSGFDATQSDERMSEDESRQLKTLWHERAGTAIDQAAIDEAAHAAATSPQNDRPQPSHAQKQANGEGNYKLGDPVKLHGVTWRVENPKGSYRTNLPTNELEDLVGSYRRGRKAMLLYKRGDIPEAFSLLRELAGEIKGNKEVAAKLKALMDAAWFNKMPAHYARGDVMGADGDKLDAFLGPQAADESLPVFVIDTNKLNGDGFDEHKVMIGFADEGAALGAFMQSYNTGIGGRIFAGMKEMAPADFAAWAQSESKKPVSGKGDVAIRTIRIGMRDGTISESVSREPRERKPVTPQLPPPTQRLELLSADAQQRLDRYKKKLVIFASGMSRTKDLEAGTGAWGGLNTRGIGVEIGELSKPGIEALAEAIVHRNAQVFVDSGAFSVFKRNLKKIEIGETDFEALDFEKILARYEQLLEAVHRINDAEERVQLPMLVMPDIVGDQAASLALVERYKTWISVETKFRVSRPVVPIQKGELSMADAYRQVVETLGTDNFIVGIPSNEAALTLAELREFVEEVKPTRVHFLGAASDKNLIPRLEVLAEAGIDIEHVSADANLLRASLYGREVSPEGRQKDIRDTLTARAGPEFTDQLEGPEIVRLAHMFARSFASGSGFETIIQARRAAGELLGRPIKGGTADAKMVDESIELGAAMRAREIVMAGGAPRSVYDKLVALYGQMPTLGTRTSTSVAEQAYSTPLPLAYLAAQAAGITGATTVYEPSAGNGALLMTAVQASVDGKVQANELNADRAANLRATMPSVKVTANDAAAWRPKGSFDVVIGNPPFGVVKDDAGNTIRYQVDGEYSTGEIDHAISMKALEAMKDGGSAVLIVGSIAKTKNSEEARSDAYNSKSKREFYLKLYGQYHVVDHFTVDGDLYAKQGAGWPIDVIVIRGRGKSDLPLPAVKPPRQYDSWQSLGETLDAKYEGAASSVRTAVRDVAPIEPGPESGDGRDGGSRGARGPDRQPEQPAPGRSDDVRVGPVVGESGGPRSSEPQPRELAAPERGDDAERRPRRVAVAATEGGASRQVPYKPASTTPGMSTLVPVNMQTAIQDALDSLTRRVGNIEQFVADRLGYKPDELATYFGAEQVDALALGLDNLERGAGFIIGDQTGIGKGRVVAAVLRYAMRAGRTPIFITEKPNLYGDMYRDLSDIGIQKMLGREPEILMTNAAQTIPLDEEGKRILKSGDAGSHNGLLNAIADAGTLGGKYDMVFSTYSQMQTLKGESTPRMRFLETMANGGIVIFDESHNAGGSVKQKEGKKPIVNRSTFARSLSGIAHGVFYSSATYAKRPDVMDLYASTDMRLAVSDISNLAEAIQKGGVPMQQVVASMLAGAGQYVRRERSFDGIVYNAPVINVSRKTYSDYSNSLAAIQKFSETYIPAATKRIDKEMKAEGKSISPDGSTGGAGATSTNFTSVMHNLIDQMLLSITSDAAATRAIEALQKGEKPVITVANTMGSFIEDFVEGANAHPGDKIAINFNSLLTRYLERTRWISIRKPFAKGPGLRHYLTDDEVGPLGVSVFEETKEAIRRLDFGALPVSPIDHIRQRLLEAGYKVGEITGRQHTLDYRKGGPFYRVRSTRETSIRGRRETISGFNRGDLDVMIINQAGSTGLSLHASKTFKDQRKRRMILAQAEKNIDTHMQMLGRVNRTGQVVLPEYDQLVADVPAIKRPAAVLSKKMASLNANTTASRGHALKAENVPDFINEYGDLIAARLMSDDHELHERLGEPLGEPDGDGFETTDAARKVTGRIPLLPIEEQERLYEQLEGEYADLLRQKEAAGESVLEAKTLDLDARVESRKQVIAPQGIDSPFADGVYVEEAKVKRLGKPHTSAEVLDMLAEELKIDRTRLSVENIHPAEIRGRAAASQIVADVEARMRDYRRSVVDDMATPEARANAEARIDGQISRFRDLMQVAHVGQSVRIQTHAGNYFGVVVKIEQKGEPKNPVALSTWKVTLAMADSSRKQTLPMSQLDAAQTLGDVSMTRSTIMPEKNIIADISIIRAFDELQTEAREDRTIVTGNLLAGFEHVGRGTIINFTDAAGGVRQGIMMPRGYNYDKARADLPVALRSADQVLEFVRTGHEAKSTDRAIIIKQHGDGLRIEVAEAKKVGGKYYLNRAVLNAIGEDFVSVGSRMRADITSAQAETVIEALKRAGASFEADENLKAASEIAGRSSTVSDGASDDGVELLVGSQQEKGKGIGVKAARAFVQKLTAAWARLPARVIVTTRAEMLGMPEQLKQALERRDPRRTSRGMHVHERNAVWIFADNIPNTGRLALTLIHEILGHYAAYEYFGDSYATVRDFMLATFPQMAAKLEAGYSVDMRTTKGRDIVGNEVIAWLATEMESGTASQRMKNAFERFVLWLNRNIQAVFGRSFDLTTAEARDLIRQASRYVRTGLGNPVKQTKRPRHELSLSAGARAPSSPQMDAVTRAPSVQHGFEPEWASESRRHKPSGAPNSVVEKERATFNKGKVEAREFSAYDNDGKLVGVLSVATKGDGAGAFKVVVRNDAQRKGWGSKLLDAAKAAGVAIDYGANRYTRSGRALTLGWLSKQQGGDVDLDNVVSLDAEKSKRRDREITRMEQTAKRMAADADAMLAEARAAPIALLTDAANDDELNLILGDEADRRGRNFFNAIGRVAKSALDGTDTVLRKTGKGQPLDRLFRTPFALFGSIDAQGVFHLNARYKRYAVKAVLNARAMMESNRLRWLRHTAGMVHRNLVQQYGIDDQFTKAIETAKRGLIDRYGLDKPYLERDLKRQADERGLMMQARDVLKQLVEEGVGKAEAETLYRMLTGGDVTDAHMAGLAVPIRAAIDSMGAEAVELGLLSAESFERNRGAYLHRSYRAHEANQTSLSKFVSDLLAKRRRKIIGNQFKGRGIFLRKKMARVLRDVPEDWWGRSKKKDRADAELLGRKFRVFDRVTAPGEGTTDLSGIAPKAVKEKVLERIYWPADLSVPAKFVALEARGIFEVRDVVGGELVLWRDFTAEERERMGEIVDARYAIAKTYQQMAHDLSTGRFFKDIAENPDWASTTDPTGDSPTAEDSRLKLYADAPWVKVPDTKIEKSNTYRYGALAGMYVRSEIWRDMAEIGRMQKAGFWREVMKQWKLNKTARNPVVHFNNIMSNILLMDMADVRLQDFVGGLRSFVEGDEHYKAALQHGAFGADIISQEIRDHVLKPILAEIEGQNIADSRTGIWAVMTMVLSKIKNADQKMIDLYRLEDELFRMATYQRKISLGLTPEAAAAAAREQFLNYDIRAPWVNALRETVLPFIAYTYRAVPIVAKSLADRPWKLAKYFTVAYLLNALGYALAGDDDEDEERATLRPEEQGRTWIGVYRMLRTPFNDQYGNPIFLDVRRFIPAGDVFDMNQGSSALPIPAPFQFGGPLMIGAEFALNKQGFTGEEITNELTDTGPEMAAKLADFLWKSAAPSAPWIPGSWYQSKIVAAATGELDPMMRESSVPLALANSFGIKLKPHDVVLNRQYAMMRFDAVERALNTQLNALARDYARRRIDLEFYNAEVAAINQKRIRLAAERGKLAPQP